MSDKDRLTEKSMDEQAKRMAMTFADYAASRYLKIKEGWLVEGVIHTTEQLYDKFLFEVMARLEEDI